MEKNKQFNSMDTWNSIAQSFDKTRRKPWDQCIDFINSLSENDTVADIACGNGRHLIPLAKKCKKAIALDISNELLEISKKKASENNLENIIFIHSNALNLPFEDNSFDTILFIASLHNIEGKENRIKCLKEIKRVLKKDSKALISVWSRWQDKYRKEFFTEWFKQNKKGEFGDINIYWRQHGLNIPRFYHLYSKKEFINDLKTAGLEIIEIKDTKLHSKKHPDNYFATVQKTQK